MFDHFRIEINNRFPQFWKQNPYLRGLFKKESSEETGEDLKGKSQTIKRWGLEFILYAPESNGFCRMEIHGSIHKYFNNSDFNNNRFTHTNLVEAINDLSAKLNFSPHEAILRSFEFGVNLITPQCPIPLIQSVVSHRVKEYVPYRSRNRRKGVFADKTDYIYKIYNKSLIDNQRILSKNRKLNLKIEKLDCHIIRVEFKIMKMRVIKGFNILTFADLLNLEKVTPLLDLLIESIEDTIFAPHTTDLSAVIDADKERFRLMRDPLKWSDCTKDYRYKALKRLPKILEKCNVPNYQLDLKDRVIAEWDMLLKIPNKAVKVATFTPTILETEKQEVATFTPFKCDVEKSPNPLESNNQKIVLKIASTRCCETCGKDISMNRKGSIFCSEKYNPDAKKCRNKNSNPKNNFRTQFKKINKQPSLFDIPELLPENRKAWVSDLI
jgi:hypothetical protein